MIKLGTEWSVSEGVEWRDFQFLKENTAICFARIWSRLPLGEGIGDWNNSLLIHAKKKIYILCFTFAITWYCDIFFYLSLLCVHKKDYIYVSHTITVAELLLGRSNFVQLEEKRQRVDFRSDKHIYAFIPITKEVLPFIILRLWKSIIIPLRLSLIATIIMAVLKYRWSWFILRAPEKFWGPYTV